MVRKYNLCGTCQHTPAYCRCGKTISGGATIVDVEPEAQTAKDRILVVADILDQDGLTPFSGEIRGNLEAALVAAHEEGYDEGYDDAKDSVGEWLERRGP